MAFNNVAFKKSMLAWDAVAKKAPADIANGVKELGGDDPKAVKIAAAMSAQVSTATQKLHDLLDKVVNAKDDKARADAAKNALNNVKQVENFVASLHLPPTAQTNLKNGLAQLAKGLAG